MNPTMFDARDETNRWLMTGPAEDTDVDEAVEDDEDDATELDEADDDGDDEDEDEDEGEDGEETIGDEDVDDDRKLPPPATDDEPRTR